MTVKELIQQSDNVVKLFLVYIVLSFSALLSGIWEYFLINRILIYEGDFSSSVSLLIITQNIISILRGLSSLFIAFYFIRWFYFSYRNIYQDEKIYYLNYKPGATIWSWFVPVLNLMYPYLIMRENYETWKNLNRKEEDYSSFPVMTWWILFLSAIFADYFGIGILEGINSPDLNKYQDNPWPFFIPGLVEIIAILASLNMLKKFKRFYEETMGE